MRIPSPQDVEGNYVVRQALETQAGILCSQMATPAERSELRRLAARVDALSTQSDRSMYPLELLEPYFRLHSAGSSRFSRAARALKPS